jgi:hypothetical protein
MKTLLLPRKHTSASERHLCPQAVHKKRLKSPIPTLTQGTTGFQVPLHSPPCSLSVLFSTNKIFLTSAAGVHLGFHSQSGLKNPEHLNFQHMSSVHHFNEARKYSASMLPEKWS